MRTYSLNLMMRTSHTSNTRCCIDTCPDFDQKTKQVHPLNHLLKKKPCYQESITVHLMEATPPLHLEPDYSKAELVGYTRPPLVNVIPWIRYEAQNMLEPTFRQEFQCIREINHLPYIIAMIVWFHRWKQEQGWWPSLPACHFRNQNDTWGETSPVGTNYSPIPGQSGPQEPNSGACCPQCTVHYVTSAAGRDLIYAPRCTGICHFH